MITPLLSSIIAVARYYDTSPTRIQLLRFLLLVRTEIAGDLVFRSVAGKFRFITATLRQTRTVYACLQITIPLFPFLFRHFYLVTRFNYNISMQKYFS